MAGQGNQIGQAYIGIIPDAHGISGSIEKAISPEATSAGQMAGKNISGGISSSLQSAGKAMMKAGAVASLIAVPVVKGIKSALSAYETQIVNEMKLTEIYKTRLGVTEDVAKATMNLAKEIQAYGVVGDETIIAGAQQVATYVHSADAVNNLLPAMTDLLVQQNGYNASAQDAVAVANLVGKVMNGQVGALRRVGISFDKNQEAVLKYGTEEEKIAMLSEVINENVGYMNKALADSPLGKIQQMKNSLGDLKESLGAQLAPVIARVAEWVSEKIVPALEKLIKFMGKHPIIAKMAVAFAGLLAVGGPLLITLGMLISSIGAIVGAVGAVSAPVVGIVALVSAVIAGLTTLYVKNEKFRNAVNKLASFLAGTFKAVFKASVESVKKFITAIKNIASAVSTAWGKIKSFGSSVYKAIATPIQNAVGKVRSAIKTIKGLFPLSVGKIMDNIKLPHFKVSGGKAPWGFGGKGKTPDIDIKWYAQGFMTKGTSLIGIGERGQEALVPLKPFWDKLDSYGRAQGDITINVYATEHQSVEDVARAVEQRLIQSTKRRGLAWQ